MADGYMEHGVVGYGLDISADGRPEFASWSCTVDWDTVAALVADLTLADGTIVKAGRKCLLAGQLMIGITRTGVAVVTLNNIPTGGTFTVTVATTLPDPGGSDTTTALAFNASAATVQAAIRLLDNVVGFLPTVSGSAGGPYTIAFPRELGEVTVTADGALLTGAGAQPTATVATTEEGGDTDKMGPYEDTAGDGRANITDPQYYGLVRKLYVYDPDHARRSLDTHIGLVIGGRVKRGLIRATAGAHSLADGPTWAELKALMPRLVLVAGYRPSHT
jgi:hypothetical protein